MAAGGPHLPGGSIWPPLASALAIAALLAGCGSRVSAEPRATDNGQTEAVLSGIGDEQGSGTIVYRKKQSGSALLIIRLRNLRPLATEGQYMLWLLSSRHDMVALASYRSRQDGQLHEHLVPNLGRLSFLEDGSKTELMVTRVADAADHDRALGGGETPYDPPYIGRPVLRGSFTGPLVGSVGSA